MKIMIANDGLHAHYYERMAWAKAFNACGHRVSVWDINQTSPFDAFDKFEPDAFIGQSYNTTKSVYKCIKERPHLKVALRAGDWGHHGKEVKKYRDRILFAQPDEIDLIKKLKEETGKPDFVYIHYDEDAVEVTHDHWEDNGIDVVSLLMSADVFDYTNGEIKDQYVSDISFVGGYWPYKAHIIDPYLGRLCYPVGKYNIKIFGNQLWNVPQYMGFIDNDEVKHVFASAKICPNLSEPHAHEYGFDVNERCFKLLANKAFCISDSIESIKNIFSNDEIVFADSPEDFHEKVQYYLDNPEKREDYIKRGYDTVIAKHTNFHRASKIMSSFGLDDEASAILEKLKELEL